MKKIKTLLVIILFSLIIVSCTKREENQGRLISKDEQLELQIWTSSNRNAVESLAREFLSSTGTTTIQLKVIEFENDEDLHKILLDKMAEGISPDIIFTEGSWIWQNYKKLAVLNDDPEFNIEAFKNTFVIGASEILIRDNNILGIPMTIDSLGIVYNESHLISNLDDRNVPATTWAEFRKDMEKLTKTNNSVSRISIAGAGIGDFKTITYAWEILQNIMWQTGVQFFSPDNMSATLTDSNKISDQGNRVNLGEEALSFFTSFTNPKYKNFSWNKLFAGENENIDFQNFAKGKVSMVFAFAKDLENIENLILQTPNNISIKNMKTSLLPQDEYKLKNNEKNVIAKVSAFAIPRTAMRTDISWKFLKFVADKTQQSNFYKSTGLPTARLDLISEQVQQNPIVVPFIRQAKFAKNIIIPLDENLLENNFRIVIQAINEGKLSPSKALKRVENALDLELIKINKQNKLIEKQI